MAQLQPQLVFFFLYTPDKLGNMTDNSNLLLLHAKINHIIRGVLVYVMSSLRVAAGCPPHTTQPQPHLMLLLSDFDAVKRSEKAI